MRRGGLTSSLWALPVLASRRRATSSGASAAAAVDAPAEIMTQSQVDAEKRRIAGLKAVAKIFYDAKPGPNPEDVMQLLGEAKNERELRKVVHEIAMLHPLFLDPLNGHGYRVAVFSKLLMAATRIGDIELIFDVLAVIRQLAFVLTRNFAAVILDNVKRYINNRFLREGRNPNIVEVVLLRCRQLRIMCQEDKVFYDFVMHSRELHIAASLVAVFDRQNLYRASFPADDVPRREAIIVEWVIAHQRCVDFDWAVEQTRVFVQETVDRVKDSHTRPSFSFMKRLADYRFATDDFEGMRGVIEECHAQGIDVIESTFAKLMQLACAFNIKETPELVMLFRACTPHCTLAAPDVSRLLGFYCRSGGGKPCPECGEPFNHRNPCVDVWNNTPRYMKECSMFQDAQRRRGVLEDNPNFPGSRDYSAPAFALLDLSTERSISWGVVEWRMFIMCVTFSDRALEGASRLTKAYDRSQWDEMLAMVYIRLLRFNHPEAIVPTLQAWRAAGMKLSPLPLQQAVKGQVLVEDREARVEGLRVLVELHEALDVYCTHYAHRVLTAHAEHIPNDSLGMKEREYISRLTGLTPRRMSSDSKDSVSDVASGQSKRHQLYEYSGYASA